MNFRKPAGCVTLEDKKHRLLCCFFESSIQTLLSPLSNISRNLDAEAFSFIFYEGYNDDVSIRETLELDAKTHNLLPIITNPGNSGSAWILICCDLVSNCFNRKKKAHLLLESKGYGWALNDYFMFYIYFSSLHF